MPKAWLLGHKHMHKLRYGNILFMPAPLALCTEDP